jgi:hypothetical protein
MRSRARSGSSLKKPTSSPIISPNPLACSFLDSACVGKIRRALRFWFRTNFKVPPVEAGKTSAILTYRSTQS